MLKQRVLSNKSFRNLWFGQTISQLGDSMYYLMFLFMADHVSKNPMIVGIVGALSAIPFVIFGPLAGVWVDRADRRMLMLGADILSGTFTFLLSIYAFFTPSPQVWVLCMMAFLMSTVNTVFFPARSASIPRLVPEEQVIEANSLSEASRQIVAMVGLGVSAAGLGALYNISPVYFFFAGVLANSITFFASAVFIAKLPKLLPLQSEQEEAEAIEQQGIFTKILNDVKVGFGAIKVDPIIRLALPINMLTTLAIAGFFVVYLALNREWYGGGYTTLAWIEFAFSVPMLLGSLWVGQQVVKHPGRWYVLGQAGVGATVVIMAFCKPYWSMILINVICGFFLPLLIIPLQSYLQLAVHDQVRGRVNSTWLMVSQAMNPIGVAIIGPLLQYGGIETALIVMGTVFGGAGLIGLSNRAFMNTPMPSIGNQAA